MAVGTRIYVHGEGHGTYAGFTGRWIGANEHTIKFDSGETKTLKLKEMWPMRWAVKDSDIKLLVAIDRPPNFEATGSIVECTVPEGATAAAIEACGAQGGGSTGFPSKKGGLGARVVCRAAVRPGERLAGRVGRAGGTAKATGGGGGGSFVVRAADGSPLAVAGGGGGLGDGWYNGKGAHAAG